MPTDNSSSTLRILTESLAGDSQAWSRLIEKNEPRLMRMITLRLDQRLHRRIDSADVLQETYIEAWSHLSEYLSEPKVSFFVWLRSIAGHKLMSLHRRHLGANRRDARREVSLYRGALPETTSAALAAQLIDRFTRPSEEAMLAELRLRLETALDRLEPIDREVLALRHFEHLTNVEVAEALGIATTAASNRYVRALKRLREVFPLKPGDVETSQ
jgi:RNA polymerase sigma-70 factor (ECF subfamily)